MARLILLPELPGANSGYQKAVAYDLKRLGEKPGDVLIAYATGQSKTEENGHIKIIARPSKLSATRALNLMQGRVPNEPTPRTLELSIPSGVHWDEVFCGEVVFYRALRELFPDMPFAVRFHNYYHLVAYRQGLRDYPLSKTFRLTIGAMLRLEKEIARDPLVKPIFITPEEEAAFRIAYPMRETEHWNPADELPLTATYSKPRSKKMVWLGGVSAHKAFSLRLFINLAFRDLRKKHPDVELHLYGKNTLGFHAPQDGVMGYGYYEGSNFPEAKDSLYVNPDLLGGGIKIKVGDWLREGIPFISTPFGVEGYNLPRNENIMVAELDRWAEVLGKYYDAPE